MTRTEALLALHLTGVVGPRRYKALREAFPELSDALGASCAELEALPDWTPSTARKVLEFKDPLGRVCRELEEAAHHGFAALVEGEPGFPTCFQNLYDPPFILWRWGGGTEGDERALAVIGCRQPSPYGKQAALRIAQEVAGVGYTVVSGMARGIDSLAHRGALQHPSGRTIAFLGSGLLNLYPPENVRLAAEIARRGAVYSEYPLHAKPMPMHFPQRNRLISAASRGVLVVEARMDSGSFITVDHAVEQGRPVFAVPGPIQSRQSTGTHALIQQGATLVSCVEDIFHELRDLRAQTLVRSGGARVPPAAELDPEEKRLLDSLTPTPSPVDLLARECGLEPRRLNELLLGLEMKGLVEQAPGRAYFRV